MAYIVQNQAHINQIELNKIKQQAIKEKPQRADQLPQESVFELNSDEIEEPDRLVNFQDETIVTGAKCKKLAPQANFKVFRLFDYAGHIEYTSSQVLTK